MLYQSIYSTVVLPGETLFLIHLAKIQGRKVGHGQIDVMLGEISLRNVRLGYFFKYCFNIAKMKWLLIQPPLKPEGGWGTYLSLFYTRRNFPHRIKVSRRCRYEVAAHSVY